MRPQGESIALENTDDVCAVGAVIGAAFLVPNAKLRSSALQNRCNRILGRFMPYVVLGEPLEFPHVLSVDDKDALKIAAEVTAEHAAKAVGLVNALEGKTGMCREAVLGLLTLGDELMVSTALLANSATIEATAEVTAALAEIGGLQPPSPQPPTEA